MSVSVSHIQDLRTLGPAHGVVWVRDAINEMIDDMPRLPRAASTDDAAVDRE